MRANISIHNMDCMEAMKEMDDNQFDLAIVDPPYGIGASRPSEKPNRVRQKNGLWLTTPKTYYKHKGWDNTAFSYDQFFEVLRVSKNQIIWGCNFFDFKINGGRIVWDKLNGHTDQHDCEIAYTSMGYRTDIVRYLWSGMMQGIRASKNIREACIQQGNKSLNEKRIHPTQKPVALYKWLLTNYAQPGDKILDTHLGSGSIAIACWDLKYDLTAYEIDEEYYQAAVKRLKQHQAQTQLF